MKMINCILLVDDNPADNEFHKIVIDDAQVCKNVKIATNGKKALEYIMKSGTGTDPLAYPKPDLIFLDINMPGMNGFEFLNEYHNLDEKLKSKIVIIMLSTSLNPDDSERAHKIKEVTDFMNKPLMGKTLRATVEKYF